MGCSVINVFGVRSQELAQLDLVAGPRGCVKLRHLVRVRARARARVGWGLASSQPACVTKRVCCRGTRQGCRGAKMRECLHSCAQ